MEEKNSPYVLVNGLRHIARFRHLQDMEWAQAQLRLAADRLEKLEEERSVLEQRIRDLERIREMEWKEQGA